MAVRTLVGYLFGSVEEKLEEKEKTNKTNFGVDSKFVLRFSRNSPTFNNFPILFSCGCCKQLLDGRVRLCAICKHTVLARACAGSDAYLCADVVCSFDTGNVFKGWVQ